ncbi:MAG: methyltransferase domain-containing protein [Planctomycetia bacterium]|nr:methyltransferase domain-containing protein [Planctomycetia bacterium]
MKGSHSYILATGQHDVDRLRLLNQVYGPGSEALLRRAGLAPGMRVVEMGCGSGNMSCWLASQVGETGSVVGFDASPEQIEQARRQAQERGLKNLTFELASAYTPGLPAESFDLAYGRLVLMHLVRPADALLALHGLVRPGGRLVCEEMDVSGLLCDPPAPAMERFVDLNLQLGDQRGVQFRLGRSLHRLFRLLGINHFEVGGNCPFAVRGENKRLIWLTFVEFAPRLLREGLATQAEAEAVGEALHHLAEDETTLLGFPPLGQVWAVK